VPAVVAVVALPERAPEKVVAVRVLVDGLKVSPAVVLIGWLPVAVLLKVMKSEVLATSLVRLTLVALVAVVAVVAVVALPERAAVIVPAEKLPEASRRTKVEAVLVERADGIYSTLQEAAVVPEVKMTVAIR
jgi:hypothetical protein